MSNILQKFSKLLTNLEYPKEKCSWHISGILTKYSNQILKFDVRGMKKESADLLSKPGSTNSKADKIVFETDKDWVIIDVPELHDYLRKQSVKIVQFEDLLVKLEWNIVLPKK